MIKPEHAQTMARYNKWQNENAFAAANTLDDAARDLDRGSFFGSIRQTLNHLYWGDRIWMSRFTADVSKPASGSIGESVGEFADWPALCDARSVLDQQIIDWAASITQDELIGDLSWYSGVLKDDVTRPLALCIVHFFNHQTHHRGQVHAMLTAAGCKTEDTDLFLMPESV